MLAASHKTDPEKANSQSQIPITPQVNLVRKSPLLGRVDNSFPEVLRPTTCARDPEILLNAQHYCTEMDRSGSRAQVVARRDLNCQQTLNGSTN